VALPPPRRLRAAGVHRFRTGRDPGTPKRTSDVLRKPDNLICYRHESDAVQARSFWRRNRAPSIRGAVEVKVLRGRTEDPAARRSFQKRAGLCDTRGQCYLIGAQLGPPRRRAPP
jgi:hypothetical protein